MLSLRGNREDSYSDSDDASYSSFDESMDNFRVSDTRAKSDGSQVTTGSFRRAHDFLKRDDDKDENSSDGMEDTNIVSRLQRFVDSIDKHSYELMSSVRSRDWKAALTALEELKKNVSYLDSQGARVPYSFLSGLKFTQDFFAQPAQAGEEGDEPVDALSQIRHETPKELRKTLSDFQRDIKALCEERAQQIERMDDEDSDADDGSDDSDVDLEEMLRLGSEGPAGEALDETLAAAVLGGKDGFSLSTLLASQELSEASIINKVQELRLKLAGGIAEKSSKDSDKRLKRMKRSRSVLFSLAMQSILREVEAAGRFPKSQALLCALLFADCFGERRQESVQKRVYKDLRALGELFPSMRLATLATVDEAAEGARHAKHQRATVRQWLMAAEYLNRYLSVLEAHPDVTKLVLSHDETSSTQFGIEMSTSLLLPFTLASRITEEYLEAVRATELHEASYLGWLRIESILLFLLERTLRLYVAREPAAAHLEHTLHLSDSMLFLLHYRSSDVHAELYDRYYAPTAAAKAFVQRDLTASILSLRGISHAPRVSADFPSIALRSSLYLIHHHAANGRVEEATRLFRTARCDEQVKALARARASPTREASTQQEAQSRTRVAYNRVLAAIATALFRRGQVQPAGEFLTALFVPQAHQGPPGHHSIYTKELLLAQLSLRHGTAIRFSAVPSMEGTGNTEPVVEHRAVRGTLERFLLPAWKTAVEDVYLPPHLHLNVELLDCIFFVYCMLYQEVSNRRGANRFATEPRVYRGFLNSYERQSFLNDPVTNKDLVYAAVAAFRTADWERCCDRLREVPLFRAVLADAPALLALTTTIKTECLKKFMLGARGILANVRVEHLSTKFTLPADEARRIISQMVVRREIYGAFADETETAFVFDHAQHTPLQKSVLQLSEKVVGTIDCAQKAQEYKHVQKLYTFPDAFGKGAFFNRNRHRGRGRGGHDGPSGSFNADDNRLVADGSAMPADSGPNAMDHRRVRGGTIRNTPLRNPFATLRGNRYVSR